ncbi:hypothetical protein K491DRAFT_198705 [Lophiostoma macrostomum CBS 122681]|uniref:Uncharacterized protein n=1 Tax=Lophiostoma macrostomum CBS 122681 TaxID=1314788 RepID=A0A6A6SSJ2_9PLEO|nr:hypothetical protein K491DRAFT_198705 [Lophiostoma macrostomum CBS 122681]
MRVIAIAAFGVILPWPSYQLHAVLRNCERSDPTPPCYSFAARRAKDIPLLLVNFLHYSQDETLCPREALSNLLSYAQPRNDTLPVGWVTLAGSRVLRRVRVLRRQYTCGLCGRQC